MAATTVLRYFTPISSSLKPPSRHRRLLHHGIIPKLPLPCHPSLLKFSSRNSESQPPPSLPEADCPIPPEQQPIKELPVSWFGSVGPKYKPVKRILAASSSGIFAVTLAVVMMYLGWAYVENRLLSATVEYEETGWYDGQRNGEENLNGAA